MATKDITNFVIYRWRYILGYSLVGLLLIGLLVFAGLYAPGGISPEEIRSTVRSDSLDFSNPQSLAIPNLPFYILQAGVFSVFGIDNFTIKLP
ncbi:hypothetical protein H7200_00055 [Candidatus Saccharibacteria bacterium]|nr:hypothetical protein [Candidatus Saccharibacteria bacterium]